MSSNPTPRLDVYWNSHRNCFSVAQNGRVSFHVPDFVLNDVKFVVRPAGRAKVRDTGRKNVHAFVRGYNLTPHTSGSFIGYVHYNPHLHDTFVLDGLPIFEALQVYLSVLNNGRPSIQIYSG